MKLKYLWVYSAANESVVNWHKRLIKKRRELGYDIVGFCCTPQYLNNRHWLAFQDLDRLWKLGYPSLIKMYKELLEVSVDRNVLIHYNGANLHPDFVSKLNMYKVYTAGDDPESTDRLTKPVAKYYDLHLINNIACIDMYKSWGLQNVFFWPLGSISTPEEIALLPKEVLDINLRNNKLVYVGERNPYKNDFFELFVKRFPFAECWGNGWENGFIDEGKMGKLYLNSQMGINIHNSTGPINFRTYELPAYGIMQLCDNKANLDKIYKLNEEVVGFDSSEECMDKVEYYLTHPKEQRDIALGGWERWKKDYTPDAVWSKLDRHVNDFYFENSNKNLNSVKELLRKQGKNYFLKKLIYLLQ